MISRPGPPTAALSMVSTEGVIERLDQGLTADSMIAFDADGTLWTGDIGVDTFEALLASRGFRPASGPSLSEEARAHGVAVHPDAAEQARLLYEAFGRGEYPEERAYSMMAWAFAGYTVDEARAFAARVVTQVNLAARLQVEVLPILHWSVMRSVPLYIVSASPAHVVRTAADLLAVPFTAVLAMSPVVVDGVLTARCADPLTYGSGKLAALHAAVPDKKMLAAFGDSAFDLPMLGEARVPVAVRPKPALAAGAHACAGLVELSPLES
jgi:phosphatidylglycerophosphatase C